MLHADIVFVGILLVPESCGDGGGVCIDVGFEMRDVVICGVFESNV